MKRDPATPALEPLRRFVGTWDTVGEVRAGDATDRFDATDEYEWLPGGHFLLHKFHARMPDGESAGIEVISHDPVSNSFAMQSFDSRGSSSRMSAHQEGDCWRFVGDDMRFSGKFSPDGLEFSGAWEIRSADTCAWQEWMTVRLSKRAHAEGAASQSTLPPTPIE